MSKQKDPVIDPLKRFLDHVDKRTSEGQFIAGYIRPSIEAVEIERAHHEAALENERMQWSSTTTELQSRVAELAGAVESMKMEETQAGFKHSFEPPDIYPRTFTVGQVAEAMIRLRVAGASDNTPVDVGRNRIECNTRLPLPPSKEEQAAERKEVAKRKWRRNGIIVGAAFFGPPVVLLVAMLVWNFYLLILSGF